MRVASIISLLFVLTHISSYSQPLFEKFKTLESQVKYTQPEKLKVFSQSLDTNDQIGKVIYYWSNGRADFWNSNYPGAYVQLEKAASILDTLNHPNLQAELYLDIAATLAVVDQNGKALSFLLEAKNIFENAGNSEQLARNNISLAEMYRKIGNYEKAFKLLHQTKKIAELNQYNHARFLNRLAAVHSEGGDHDSSLHYSFQSLSIAKEINEPDLMATAENEIGYVYRNRNQYKKALTHFASADSLWKSIGKLLYATNAMHHMSIIYASIDEIDKSLNISHEGYKLIQDKNWYQVEVKLLEDLISLKVYLKEADSVSYYEKKKLEAIINWKDQQYEVNTKMVEALFTQEQNEQIIREQKIQIEKEALEKKTIDQQRNTLIIISSLIGLMLLIIFIYAYKQRRLKNKLAKENAEKEKKNEQLTQALSANEALVQEISHRVKNNLAVLSGLLNMQALRSKNKVVSKELQDSILRIESIATIHKKLYDKRNDAKVNLKEVLLELSSNILISMGKDPAKCLSTNIEECEIDIAQGVTFCLIVNEVITNSCKYGEVSEDKNLVIDLAIKNNIINCQIKDQGKGFKMEKSDTNHSSLGLYLIQLLGKQLKSTISWQKRENYFIFSIEFTKDEHE